MTAHIGPQNKALEAFNQLNILVISKATPIVITSEGLSFFAERNRIRDVYAGMSHGGLSGTTYAPSQYR